MSILGDSCRLFTRMLLITVNLVIYLGLWGLLGTIPDYQKKKVDQYHHKVRVNSQDSTDSDLQNKIVVHDEFDNYDAAFEPVYYDQGY